MVNNRANRRRVQKLVSKQSLKVGDNVVLVCKRDTTGHPIEPAYKETVDFPPVGFRGQIQGFMEFQGRLMASLQYEE